MTCRERPGPPIEESLMKLVSDLYQETYRGFEWSSARELTEEAKLALQKLLDAWDEYLG